VDLFSNIAFELFGTLTGWAGAGHLRLGQQQSYFNYQQPATKTAWMCTRSALECAATSSIWPSPFARTEHSARYATGYLGDIGVPPPAMTSAVVECAG